MADKNQIAFESKRKDLFKCIRYPMWIAAMYPFNFEKQFPFIGTLMSFLIELFLYFVTIHIAILYSCTLYFFYREGDLEFLVNCLIQLIIYFWTIFMKLHFRRIRPGLLKDIMETLNSEYQIRSAKGLTYVTMEESIAMANRWNNIYVACCFGGTIFWLILPIAYQDHSLPLACWYPFDFKEPIIYEVLYFFQTVGQLQVAAAFSVSSGFHMMLGILISGQYDSLCCSLKNIIATSYIEMGAPAKDLKKLEKLQEISNEEMNQFYCSIERKDSFEYSTEVAQEAHLNFLQTFKLCFKNCVFHHRFLLKILGKMENFYNFIWLLKTGEVVLLMCLVAFVSVKSTTANTSFMKILSLAQYLILVIWELLIICYFSEIIAQNSRRCDEAILRSPWFLYMREMKNDFLFFLMNSQRAFKLSAGKMYSLDINRFRAVITTAFSFFTILQKMDQRD